MRKWKLLLLIIGKNLIWKARILIININNKKLIILLVVNVQLFERI